MSFARIEFVWLMTLVPMLAAFHVYGQWRRRKSLHRLLGPMCAGMTRNRARLPMAACTVAGAALLVVALLRPQWGESAIATGQGVRDLVVVVDVSQSMLATDAAPSRLHRAIGAIRQLVERLDQRPGQRLQLIAFAGRAVVVCPATTDHVLFLDRLARLVPEVTGRPGTAIGDALRRAMRDLTAEDGRFVDVLLLSDGEDHGSDPVAAAAEAAAKGVTVHVIGIGDPEQGAVVPALAAGDGPATLEYEGRPVRSRLQAAGLRQIAALTGGTYIDAGIGQIRLDAFLQAHQSNDRVRVTSSTLETLPAERFQWFVAAAAAAILLALAMPAVMRWS